MSASRQEAGDYYVLRVMLETCRSFETLSCTILSRDAARPRVWDESYSTWFDQAQAVTVILIAKPSMPHYGPRLLPGLLNYNKPEDFPQ
jgi:hypothetical protein